MSLLKTLLLTSYLSFGLLSPMIVLIDVTLSHPFCLPPPPYSLFAIRAPGAPGPPLDAPLRLFIPRDEKPSGTEPFFRDLSSVPPPPRFQDREHQETSSRHPA